MTSGGNENPNMPVMLEVPEMWETRSVELTVRLPRDIARQAEEVQESDPEFLSRIVLYGLTRRSIYQHLRDTPAPPESDDLSIPLGT